METFQNSLEKLLATTRTVLGMTGIPKQLFFDAPESGVPHTHHVPRLLVLLEGEQDGIVCSDGCATRIRMTAPLLLYSAREALLYKKGIGTPYRALSFSFFPDYIRAMEIDYDGVHPPPTRRDNYYHTAEPICPEGFQLITLIDALHARGSDETARELLLPLLRLTVAELKRSSEAPVADTNILWSRICTNLRLHCHEPVGRREIADLLRITPGYVSILCRKYSGKSFSEVKLSFQLENAKKLLADSYLNIEEIAQNCGFNSANYFIRRFKHAYGMTPGAWRNRKCR